MTETQTPLTHAPDWAPTILQRLDAASGHIADYLVGQQLVVNETQLEAAKNAARDAFKLISLVHCVLTKRGWDDDACSVIAGHLRDYGLQVRDPNDELGMTAEELEAKYAAVAAQARPEHPTFDRRDWTQAVCRDETQLGYWPWVAEQIAAEGR